MVSVHVGEDSVKHYGDDQLWFESFDSGETWKQTDSSVRSLCGLKLPDGEILSFPRQSSFSLDEYKIPSPLCLTPATDFSKKAENGTLPQQDGMTFWQGGITIRAYLADRLPDPLCRKEWFLRRRSPDGHVSEETAQLDWPYLTRVVYSDADLNNCHMKAIYPCGNGQIGPDGAIWITAFSGEGHIDPANGQYSPYYAAELFRSEDNGRHFSLYAHMEYPADGKRYPYQSGGFSDNAVAFFEDGSMSWFLRSAWYASTGYEWAPMYVSRSFDLGKTWSAPEEFSFTGVFPNPCRLDCGATLVCYARPGMFVTACRNSDGMGWTEPLTLMTPEDRSSLANIRPETIHFHDWDGACHNCTMIATGPDTALIFYCDFYYPDEDGIRRKTVLCRKLTVEM